MPARLVLWLYCAWMVAVAAAFFLFPEQHLVHWSALGLSSAGAIVAGVLRYRPTHPSAWWLLAVTVTVFAAGDTTYNVLTTLLGQTNPYPSLADVFYLAMYPIGATALLLMVRHRTGGRDRGSLLDALSLTAALALLSWIFLIDPYVRDPALGWLERATSIAYPLGDVLLLATLARLLIVTSRNRAAGLLGIGTAGLLVSDVLYGLDQLKGSWQIGSPYDLGWVVFYLAWGAAALHPSMAELTVPLRRPGHEMSSRRVALLMAASLVAPGALLVDSLAHGFRNGVMIAVSSAVFFLLVLSRLSGVVARHGQAVERERTLRSAGTALVSAADVDDVAASVCAAVERLVKGGSAQRAGLLVHTGDPTVAEPTCGPSAASLLVSADSLDGAAADVARGFSAALLCPLVLDDRPTGRSSVGLLVVAAGEAVLLTLQGALEVLASQAALAVERVALAQEVNRRNSEAYFRTLVHNAHDVILIVDDGGHVRYASPSAQAVLGPGPVVGGRVQDLLDGETDADPVPADPAGAGLLPAGPGGVRHRRVVRRDGSRIDVEVTSRDLRDDPTVHGVVLTLRNVTEQRRLQRELSHRAFHDALTGLANRVLFQDRVLRALSALDRDPGVVGVLLIDLDDFKLVNDTMGHAIGDDLLVAVAGRLGAILRPPDTAARLGGDEFAVLVERAAHPGEIEETAARVVDALSAPLLDLAGGVTISVSVGVATSRTGGPVDLLRQADLALYAAKESGKGRWHGYEPELHLVAVDRVELRTDLQRALACDELELRYQPIVDLVAGGTVGVEALVRWHHPRRGVVMPSNFIRTAEETGLIVPLGTWVLDRALADLAGWRAEAGCTAVGVSVNVSAHQVRAPRFVQGVVSALQRWDVPAGALIVEITETALLTDDAQVSADLAELREHGVRIAIDDFGTGYSSLDYVRRHTVDILKIDRSFIDGIETSRRQAALVGAIVHLAGALDLAVVAEGVETSEQRAALVLAGCRLGQGYLFSTPVPAGEVVPGLLAGAAVAVSADTAAGRGTPQGIGLAAGSRRGRRPGR